MPKDKPTDFAALIAGLESAGLSRAEIAQAAHVARVTVWRLAVGETSQPSFEVVTKIQRVYAQRCRAGRT
jgi:transcriptional regulator with XRE-family HTH domain